MTISIHATTRPGAPGSALPPVTSQIRVTVNETMHRQMATGGRAKGNGPTNECLVGIEILGPRPSKSLSSNLIHLTDALIVRPRLFVCKDPEEP